MKIEALLLVILFFSVSLLGEEKSVDKDNIFLTDEDNIFLNSDTPKKRDTVSLQFSDDLDYSEDMIEKALIDWKADISISGIVPLFTPDDNALLLETRPNVSMAFDMGMNALFKECIFASLSLRYLHLSFDVDRIESDKRETINNTTVTDIISTEELHYVSVPISLGFRYQIGPFAPYAFLEVEPAYLTAAGLYSQNDQKSTFSTGATLEKRVTDDSDIYDHRENKQLFYGGGVGLDINYGYGIVYLESCYKKSYYDHDRKGDTISSPVRGESILNYIPVTVGLRFYI